MRLLGIDFGSKRIGIAVSDELGMLAHELKVLSPKDFHKAVPGLIKEYEIEKIVVGLPLGMSGQDTEKTKEAREFMAKLENSTGLPVQAFDERLSSQMAQNLPGGKTNIDSLAAQIILQNYLDTQTNK